MTNLLPQVATLPLLVSAGRQSVSGREPLSREAGTRTPSAWSQARSADPYATSREQGGGTDFHRCTQPGLSHPFATPVEKVGIEPTTSTLARRDRSLSCHPQNRRFRSAGTRPGGPEAPGIVRLGLPHDDAFPLLNWQGTSTFTIAWWCSVWVPGVEPGVGWPHCRLPIRGSPILN